MDVSQKTQKILKSNAKIETFLPKRKNISKSLSFDNDFAHVWRTDVPLWPEWASEPPPWRPGARPGPSWERFGSVRERPGSARADPIAMEKWACAENHKKYSETFTKIKNISENDKLDSDCGNMRRTDVPLWPDWARRAPPGWPRARPGAARERPRGEKKSYSLWRNGRTQKITKKQQKS